jgi:hypothetical protein
VAASNETDAFASFMPDQKLAGSDIHVAFLFQNAAPDVPLLRSLKRQPNFLHLPPI